MIVTEHYKKKSTEPSGVL